MDKMTASRITGGNTAYKRVESDFYPTPAEVTQALVDFLKLPNETRIWEPACGQGHMANVLSENGYNVRATDIQLGFDFLRDDFLLDFDWIITNPPFSLEAEFIERCWSYGKPFALLAKSQYWHARKRLELFRAHKPSYILPLTWRPDFLFGERGGGSPLMDVMWCVWFPNRVERYEPIYYPLEKPTRWITPALEDGAADG